MSERLHIYFHEDAFDTGYCLLALRCLPTAGGLPPLRRLLRLLIDIVNRQGQLPEQSIGLLAVHVVKGFALETENASLLPAEKPPAADFAVSIRWLNQEEFWLSCTVIDHPLSLERGPLETALNGFEGNVEQLREILELI
jgi:hypothetical protein